MYEEAIETVVTVRDFTQVFDAYAQFYETVISAKMEATTADCPTEEGTSHQPASLSFSLSLSLSLSLSDI